MSALDAEKLETNATFAAPGGPDDMAWSPDGKELWITGRWRASVDVLDRETGALKTRIPVGRSPHGIFMHPPLLPTGGKSSLSYKLGKQFATFYAETTLNDGPPETDTPLTFSVYGDGGPLWKSHEIRSQRDAEPCDVDVKDVKVLTIEVNCPGEPRNAHAVWFEPHVVK